MKSEPINTNDPNLTAYAIGEMSPSELFQFEQQLKESPVARAELEEIEETIDWLRDGFATELHAPRLMAEPVDNKIVAGDFKRPGLKIMLTGSLAAAVVGLLSVGAMISKDRANSDGQMVAKSETPRVEVFQPVKVPSALPDQKSFFSIPEIENLAAGSNNGIILAGYDPVDGMMIPTIPIVADLNGTLPDILDVAAFNEGGGSFGQMNPLSYISYDNLAPTDVLEINSEALNSGSQLPGIDAIGKGKASFGTYKFQNEESKNLPDEEFGHGELSFEIRTRIVDGKVIETVRLVDTRKGPDGKETKTVKEFVREGNDVGKPIHSLLPEGIGKPQTQTTPSSGQILPASSATSKGVPSIGAVTPIPANPIVTELFLINSELSAVRDAMAADPTGAELEALQSKLGDLIKQQEVLGRKLEASIGI